MVALEVVALLVVAKGEEEEWWLLLLLCSQGHSLLRCLPLELCLLQLLLPLLQGGNKGLLLLQWLPLQWLFLLQLLWTGHLLHLLGELPPSRQLCLWLLFLLFPQLLQERLLLHLLHRPALYLCD